jgi:hypothetical protein
MINLLFSSREPGSVRNRLLFLIQVEFTEKCFPFSQNPFSPYGNYGWSLRTPVCGVDYRTPGGRCALWRLCQA